MCDMSHHCDCGPLCLTRIMPFLEGFIIIVLGVFLFMTNFGFMDPSIWKWLFPVVVMLAGFRWITRASTNDCGCGGSDMESCYDIDMMCDDESCDCCGNEEDGCDCDGECTCGTDAEEQPGCGCGGACGCRRDMSEEDTTETMSSKEEKK